MRLDFVSGQILRPMPRQGTKAGDQRPPTGLVRPPELGQVSALPRSVLLRDGRARRRAQGGHTLVYRDGHVPVRGMRDRARHQEPAGARGELSPRANEVPIRRLGMRLGRAEEGPAPPRRRALRVPGGIGTARGGIPTERRPLRAPVPAASHADRRARSDALVAVEADDDDARAERVGRPRRDAARVRGEPVPGTVLGAEGDLDRVDIAPGGPQCDVQCVASDAVFRFDSQCEKDEEGMCQF